MPYNPNNPSNWSWARAFEEHRKTVHQAELTQQIVNHLHGYKPEGKYIELSKKKQDDLYEILSQIL
tara:strand:- start:2089 stop:2286 length:198 start_codon:yes stop_codon:yes gene_type:complete